MERTRVRWALIAAVLALSSGGASAEWGGDFDPGTGPELIEWVRADLAAIVAAPPKQRAALVAGFVASSPSDTIEAVKRFRNPELLPLFHALLHHADWHLVHRALFALERYEDETVFPVAWALLAHAEPRLREKAAITCLRFWGRTKTAVPTDAAARIAELREREDDPHVRACFAALAARASGTQRVEKVSDEVRVTESDGLILSPFLRKMGSGERVAPGYTATYVARTSESSAASLPVPTRWTEPLLDFGHETLPEGRGLQPFGFPRNGGTTRHTGVDVGAFLDGAGLYACADGIVRLVYTGSDMGTEIVVEHRVPPSVSPDGLATILYMHAADVVFVAAGDRVECGQLLGSMGMSYSFENGGHFAHLHLGMYPGPFQHGHNYGYKSASEGLADWLDPKGTLSNLIAGSAAPRPVTTPAEKSAR